MEKVHTATIQYTDYLETYTARMQQNGDGWIGWIREVPEVKCAASTQEALLKTLETELHEILAAEWEAWCKQFEEDVNAGRLDVLFDKALEHLRAGRCTDLFDGNAGI